MKQHLIPGSIAAAVALAVSGAGVALHSDKPAQVTHEVALSKHAWPDLTDAEKRALADIIRTLPSSVRFDIVCNDGACTDLAQDIDDAMEMARRESVLDRSLGPLGYGVAVQVNEADRTAAVAALAALKTSTAGRLSPDLIIAKPGANAPGYVTILIGKYKAP